MSHRPGRECSLDWLTIKEEHAVKSLLLATALLGSVSLPVVDLPAGLPGDGTLDATAAVHLMLAKGSGKSGPSRGAATSGSNASHGQGGYTGNTGEGGYRGSAPNNSTLQPAPPNTP